MMPSGLLFALSTSLLTLATSSLALAQERWFLTAEAGVAVPLNTQGETVTNSVATREVDLFGIGGELGLGIFRSLIPQLSVGARVNAGLLGAEDEPENMGQGNMGFGVLSGVARIRPLADDTGRGTKLWLELAAGPGIVEDETRLVLTPGVGYTVPFRSMGLGPFARYIQVIEGEERYGGKDARILVFGAELVVSGEDEERAGFSGLGDTGGRSDDRDRDGFADHLDRCPEDPETYNGFNDHDGCPDDERVLFVQDRFVIDERIFFDTAKAELRPMGQEKLREIAETYMRERNWRLLRVQGHADSRGSEAYNLELSRQRSRAVKDYLNQLGVPADVVNVEAYGEHRPTVPGATTPAELQRNRRVEFVIERPAS